MEVLLSDVRRLGESAFSCCLTISMNNPVPPRKMKTKGQTFSLSPPGVRRGAPPTYVLISDWVEGGFKTYERTLRRGIFHDQFGTGGIGWTSGMKEGCIDSRQVHADIIGCFTTISKELECQGTQGWYLFTRNGP